MTTSKGYIIFMSICCFMAIGNKHSCAATPLDEVKQTISEVTQKYPQYFSFKKQAYYQIRIPDDKLREKVRNICLSTCDRKNCTATLQNYTTLLEMKTKCHQLCPREYSLILPEADPCEPNDMDKVLDTVSQKYSSYLKFKNEKGYDDIADPQLKKKVMSTCKTSCNRFSCSQPLITNVEDQTKATCQILCPEKDVKNCLGSYWLNY